MTRPLTSDQHLADADAWLKADNTLAGICIELTALTLYILAARWVIRWVRGILRNEPPSGPGAA